MLVSLRGHNGSFVTRVASAGKSKEFLGAHFSSSSLKLVWGIPQGFSSG